MSTTFEDVRRLWRDYCAATRDPLNHAAKDAREALVCALIAYWCERGSTAHVDYMRLGLLP